MAISFSKIPSGIKVPLFYAELDASKANTASTTVRALLIGQMLDGGKATAGKPVLVSGASQGDELFGAGSMLARMNKAFRDNAPLAEVWAIPIADPAEGTAASGTLTFTGEATAAGTVYAYIGADRVAVDVPAGQAAVAIAQAVASAIRADSSLPVTAEATTGDADAGVVTISAKNKGTLGNDYLLQVNASGYAAGEELPDGVACSVQGFAGGAGTVDLDKVAAAMGDEEYDFIAQPYADQASIAVFTKVMGDASGRWSPLKQLYGHVYTAKRGTVAELRDFGVALNDQHLTLVGLEPAMLTGAAEFLGAFVAVAMAAAEIDPARPLQTLELVGVSPAPVGSRFTLSDKQMLLSNGVATTYVSGGYCRIERAVTTYQRNAYGAADNSYFDSEYLHTLAYSIRKLKGRITTKYARHKLADDGTRYGAGQAIVTPSVIRAELIAGYTELEERGLVENVDAFKRALIVERNKSDPSRLDVLLPPDLVNGLRIFAALVQFRLQAE